MPLRLIIEAYIADPEEDIDLATMWLEDDVLDAIRNRFRADRVEIDDLSLRSLEN